MRKAVMRKSLLKDRTYEQQFDCHVECLHNGIIYVEYLQEMAGFSVSSYRKDCPEADGYCVSSAGTDRMITRVDSDSSPEGATRRVVSSCIRYVWIYTALPINGS